MAGLVINAAARPIVVAEPQRRDCLRHARKSRPGLLGQVDLGCLMIPVAETTSGLQGACNIAFAGSQADKLEVHCSELAGTCRTMSSFG